MIKNEDAKSNDYTYLKNTFRPSHADFTYDTKYGFRDYRGGGRSSARETVSRVVAGAVAMQILDKVGVKVQAFVSAVGDVKTTKCYKDMDLSIGHSNIVRCPDIECANRMISEIEKVKQEGDTIG